MPRAFAFLLLAAIAVFVVDQTSRPFSSAIGHYTECITILVYNRGVAFSMFAFLEEADTDRPCRGCGYILWLKKNCYVVPVGIMSEPSVNVYDRSTTAVVDYVYWHCGFDFAVFNFADVDRFCGGCWF